MKTEMGFENVSFIIINNNKTTEVHIFNSLKKCFQYIKRNNINKHILLNSITEEQDGNLFLTYSERGLLIISNNVLQSVPENIFKRKFTKKKFKLIGKLKNLIEFKENYSIYIHSSKI